MYIKLSGDVKNIVDNCGLSYLWLSQSIMYTNQAKQLIHTRIEEVTLHNWYTDISTSSMCAAYFGQYFWISRIIDFFYFNLQ